ncbi:ParA family protein [Kitasatospora sp. NBC_01302]|uniref:ParA family protein n=1 Tax=Kitasatospora sp. NBC_01302 TaxID=2903575 RepID=UPI002E0DD8BE|nr:AAA family ATPase [Kitasatospora sp. NBC_01302]
MAQPVPAGPPDGLPRVDFSRLDPVGGEAAIIAMAMQKGGVGKTETTKGLGDQLSRISKPTGKKARVLYVDFDPNGTLSDGVGVTEDDQATGLASVVLEKDDAAPVQDLVYAVTEDLHILPARLDLFKLKTELVGMRGRERRLWLALQPLLPYYDAILIDCEPDLGSGTDNALYAAAKRQRGGVLVVVALDGPSMRCFETLLDQIESLEMTLDVRVPLLGWFANQASTTSIAKKYRGEFEAMPLAKLGEMPVRSKIKEAWDADKLLSDYASPVYDANYLYTELAKKVWELIS